MKHFVCIFLLLVVFSLWGCTASYKSLNHIEPGMSIKETVDVLGESGRRRGVRYLEDGRKEEFWEYTVSAPFTSFEFYWFFFIDDKLSYWCRAGHWGTTDKIKKYDFTLHQEN